jgi:hypothetical protein
MSSTRKQFDPNWPFPQYDENGKRLLPPDWNKRQPKQSDYPSDIEDALL